ncbi:hypothetical protein FACS1894172_00050 [Spirochaetia bacterium]|nr:hypothetical protein FACS1894164_06610 [Spirochaetia bacterium]GHU29278.1 hypothetical protein FACS1894172_00050 [Spirochaetia bacterium]
MSKVIVINGAIGQQIIPLSSVYSVMAAADSEAMQIWTVKDSSFTANVDRPGQTPLEWLKAHTVDI